MQTYKVNEIKAKEYRKMLEKYLLASGLSKNDVSKEMAFVDIKVEGVVEAWRKGKR